jgi:hypothetical protein
MPRPLSPAQRLMLATAAQRDGLVIVPAGAVGAARGLLRRGLVREVRSEPGQPSWRPGWALVLTRKAAGRPRRRAIRRGASPASARPVAERLVAIFTEARGRPPADLAELEAFIVSEVRAAALRRVRH